MSAGVRPHWVETVEWRVADKSPSGPIVDMVGIAPLPQPQPAREPATRHEQIAWSKSLTSEAPGCFALAPGYGAPTTQRTCSGTPMSRAQIDYALGRLVDWYRFGNGPMATHQGRPGLPSKATTVARNDAGLILRIDPHHHGPPVPYTYNGPAIDRPDGSAYFSPF